MSISSNDIPELEPIPTQTPQALGGAGQATNPFSPVSPTAPPGLSLTAGDLNLLMQQMVAATQAATEAAKIAASVAQTGSSSSDGKGLEGRDLLKILPRPEPFKVDKLEDEHSRWVSWYWQFRQYLCAIDSNFDREISLIERDLHTEVTVMPAETQARSFQLYALLSALIKGRAFQIVKQVSLQRGYEALRMLLLQFQPPSKVRSLGILSALTQLKGFNTKEPYLPQILELERGFEQYELASGEAVQASLKSALLLRSLSGVVRQRISASLPEDASYTTLREAILRYERTQFKWGTHNLFGSDSVLLGSPSKISQDEPVPMEVDRVKGKGGKGKSKGKGKGDSKGKGGKPLKGNPKGKQSGKGEQRKGKKGSKGKGSYTQGPGKGAIICHNCHKAGHYARDCWQPKVQQVQDNTQVQQPQPPQPSYASSVPSSAWSAAASSQVSTAVRRVEQVFVDMSALDLHSSAHVNMVQTSPAHFRLDSSDDDGDWVFLTRCSNEMQPCLQIQPSFVRAVITELEDEPELCTVIVDSGADVSCLPRDYVDCGQAVKPSPITVQDAQGGLMQVSDERLIEFVIPSESHGDVVIRERCIIADVTQPLLSMGRLIKKGWFPCRGDRGLWLNHDPSGADVKMHFKGMSLTVQAVIRRVEQPNCKATASSRSIADPSTASSRSIADPSTASSRSSADPSTASSRSSADPSTASSRSSADPSTASSRSIADPSTASSRSSADPSTASSRSIADPSTASSRSSADPSTASSRSVLVHAIPIRSAAEPCGHPTTVHHSIRVIGRADLSAECEQLGFGWQVLSSGNLAWRGRSSRMVDPTLMASTYWPYRSTLMRRDESSLWFVLEQCEEWQSLEDFESDIPGGGVAELLVLLHVHPEPLTDLGIHVHDSLLPPPGDMIDHDTLSRELEELEAEERMQDEVPGEGVPIGDLPEAQLLAPVPLPDMEESRAQPERVEGSITVDGIELSCASTIQALKAACVKFGLRTSGSKTRLFQRLKGYLEKQQLSFAADLARDSLSEQSRQPNMQSMPSPPSREQQLIHEITHMPYAAWCPHCVSMRAMPDRSESLVEGSRDVPCISYDFCYTGYDPESNEFLAKEPKSEDDLRGLLCCLIAHDSSTGSVLAVPCESKASTRHLGVELMRFIQGLGHAAVQIRCDSEPATLSLQKAIVTARQRLGLKTLEQNPPIHHHQSNGAVEKAVDLIRRLAMTMVQCVRAKAGVGITAQHPLFSWSFVHAAWVRNRFAVRGGLTSYERCTGNAYTGRLVAYGEPVFSEVIPRKKGNPRFVRTLFLTKTTNDMYVVASKAGVRVCRSVRRTGGEWSVDKALYQEVQGFPWQYSSAAVGTRLVPPAKGRKPQPAELHDEAASDPPTPAPLGFSTPAPASGLGGLVPVTPAEALPPLGPVPPPEGALPVPTIVVEDQPGPSNPSQQPEIGPATPEAMLPEIPVASDVVMTSPPSFNVEPNTALEDDTSIKEPESKVPRIRNVTFGGATYALNDEGYDADYEEWVDAETFYAMQGDDDPVSAAWYEAGGASALWFVDQGKGEPVLTDAELYNLDRLADDVEVSRLVAKGVMRQVEAGEGTEGMKSLSSKFVRSWRQKEKHNRPHYLRRSRLVAREFKWLEERQGLFSRPVIMRVVGDTSFFDVFQVSEMDHSVGSSSMWTTYVLT